MVVIGGNLGYLCNHEKSYEIPNLCIKTLLKGNGS